MEKNIIHDPKKRNDYYANPADSIGDQFLHKERRADHFLVQWGG